MTVMVVEVVVDRGNDGSRAAKSKSTVPWAISTLEAHGGGEGDGSSLCWGSSVVARGTA